MTENIERFRVMNHDDYELDYVADRCFNFKKLDLYDCCELLNKFQDLSIEDLRKIEQLGKENKELKEFKQKVFDLIDGKVYRFIDCPMVLLELKKELNDD